MADILIFFLSAAAAGSAYLIARQGYYQVRDIRTARSTKAILQFQHPEGGFNNMMTRHEAAAVIGIEYPHFHRGLIRSAQAMTKRKVKERYRKVMLLNHPDRGGSPYLAMKINEARRVLMRYCR